MSVYLRWTSGDSRSAAVPIRITYNGGFKDTLIDMRKQGGLWNWLGTFSFVEGKDGGLQLSTTGTTGYVIADAARFSIRNLSTGTSSLSRVTKPVAISLAPNPFNPSLQIRYYLVEKTRLVFQVYSLEGKIIKTLKSGEIGKGNHLLAWDDRDATGKTVSNGVYLISLKTPGFKTSLKVVHHK
jgi:hypothetical protein